MTESQPRVRTLLIEDSGLMRILLGDMLRKDPGIELIATASNGMEGVQKAKLLKPDVVITDMVMPGYDGLFVVQSLMKEMPLPIILLSSLDRANPQIFDALNAGAFDFVEKPDKQASFQDDPVLLRMVREAVHSNAAALLQSSNEARRHLPKKLKKARNYDVLALGASTGGPGALEFIIHNLPENLPVPVVIAQHMPQHFIISYADRLMKSTGFNVIVPKDGEEILNNHIYLAPGISNLSIERDGKVVKAVYNTRQYKEFNNPSIDCLFESVADVYQSRAFGAILTGMGRDGAIGLKRINKMGGLAIAQDEATSVVYGMPKAAFESGAASESLPLNEIPNFIQNAL